MDEYIEREEIRRAYEKLTRSYVNGNPYIADWRFDEMIEELPDADVAPVRHAKWVDNHCTACGMMPMGDEMWKNYGCEPPLFERFMDYRPSCGAKMDGGVDDASV